MGGSSLGGMNGIVFSMLRCYHGAINVGDCGGANVLIKYRSNPHMSTREYCELYAACNHMFVSCLRLPSVTVASHKYPNGPRPQRQSGTIMPDTKANFSGTILV